MSTTLPTRKEIETKDTWDLSILFKSRKDWDDSRNDILAQLPHIESYEGKIKEDAVLILSLLQSYWKLAEALELVCAYAQLEYSADSSSTNNQELLGLMSHTVAKVEQSVSFIPEELSVLSDSFLETISKDTRFEHYTQQIIQIIRLKPHILSKSEEKLLALQSEYSNCFDKSFSALTNIDMEFGTVDTPEGVQILSHATLGILLEHTDRSVRKNAFEQFHKVYHQHINTLASLYSSQVQKDNALAKIRKYKNSLQSQLFHKNIPESLYQDLIVLTNNALPTLHKYYDLLKKQMQLQDYTIYDLNAHPYPVPTHNIPYEDAVSLVCEACSPLGEEYVTILKKGLLENRWVDRYENKGKRSGAFSMGVYGAYPYILLNYQKKSLRDVFTIAHEAGHSMHSYFSSKSNPYSQHNYTIFEAEVASTVNEFLLYRHLLNNTEDESVKTYLLWHELQDFIGTFFRQTMFAEFEIQAHEHSEQGNPLTTQYFTDLSISLLKKYSGDAVIIPEMSGVTGLRIPHFYQSYYVYQYATGVAAAVDIGTRIYNKEPNTIKKYYDFLNSGGSRFPMDALALAGVDYRTLTPIENALDEFKHKCEALAQLSK